jgi:hypothetical protein
MRTIPWTQESTRYLMMRFSANMTNDESVRETDGGQARPGNASAVPGLGSPSRTNLRAPDRRSDVCSAHLGWAAPPKYPTVSFHRDKGSKRPAPDRSGDHVNWFTHASACVLFSQPRT